ncbi:plasminogen activator, urokinase a [Pimephales promelas]|uniref:plasminogen activator, urokinase a n=1 Tax=Pimephales promelas TaxID=90988 RepID=UPI001955B1E9|nr:plasminogen activator, urokinase a [Pimephales promelas]KAG1951052.1 urokinase-type plasminogen activator [Pimephales promelas]
MMFILRILALTCALSLTAAINPWRKNILTPGEDECILDGRDETYRGKVSTTVNGRMCMQWNSIPKRYTTYRNCYHNFCRNPDNRIQPWCIVRKKNRYVRQYCDVPRMEMRPIKSQPTPVAPKQDTESTCGERRLDRITKIIGGSRSSVESQPWMAAIFRGDGFICGGTLIAPCWVLTAAHCFPAGKDTKIRRYSVILGKNAINETNSDIEQRFTVSKLVVHEDFDYTTENFTHDIALLKIVGSNGQCAVKTNSVRTACLPPFQQMLPTGFYCDIAGYGRHQKDGFEFSRHLKQAQVKLISQNACQKYYSKDEVNKNMLCAIGRDWEEDACQGDSGGPLVCEVNHTMFLFGIISWGKECAEKLNPGVYTKITNYNHWISIHTGLPTYTAGSKYPQKH